MITAKFGGTAITPQNFSCVKRLVGKHHGCVVVSAVGKQFSNDIKTTDLLNRHFLGDESAWHRIEQKYKNLVLANGVKIDVEQLLHSAKLRSTLSLPCCMSLGEELSAKITAAFLGCQYIEADSCVRFRADGKFNAVATKNNLKSIFSGVKLGVIGGFYGGSTNGRMLFPRGGSDVTGAVCAAYLGSSLYENWTDVNGVCVSDPKLVPNVETLSNLSYWQMYCLAQAGAQVLHPAAVRFAQKVGLPIKVGNYLNSCGASTVICNCPSDRKFLSVAEKSVEDKIVTTVLHNMNFSEVLRLLAQIYDDVSHNIGKGVFYMCGNKNCCTISPTCVKLTTNCSILPLVYKVFDS